MKRSIRRDMKLEEMPGRDSADILSIIIADAPISLSDIRSLMKSILAERLPWTKWRLQLLRNFRRWALEGEVILELISLEKSFMKNRQENRKCVNLNC